MEKAAGDPPADAKQRSGGRALLLRRIARRRQQPSEKPPDPPRVLPRTPEQAASTAISRAMRKSCDLASVPTQMKIWQSTLAETIELIPDRALLLVVENEAGVHGLVALSPGFLASVIEMQSIGRVLSHPPPERRPTRTDASICAELVNAALIELSVELEMSADAAPLPRFRFSSFVEDPGPLALMFDEVIYDSFCCDLRLGDGGARAGTFLAFLPAGQRQPFKSDDIEHSGRLEAGVKPVSGRSLAASVRTVPVTLNGVLCRKELMLRDIQSWVPGSVIPLSPASMTSVRLETSAGRSVLSGKLGVAYGRRAIRIQGNAQAEPHFYGSGADALTMPDALVSDFTNGKAVSLIGADAERSAENVFVNDDVEPEASDAPVMTEEPPLGDIGDPDLFRSGINDEDAHSLKASPTAIP